MFTCGRLTPGAECHTPINSSASGYGSGLIRTLFTTLKTAAFAPIPTARVTSAIAVNVGARVNRRRTGGIGAISSTYVNDRPRFRLTAELSDGSDRGARSAAECRRHAGWLGTR